MVGISVIIVEKIIQKKYEAVLKVWHKIQIGSPKFPGNTFQKTSPWRNDENSNNNISYLQF